MIEYEIWYFREDVDPATIYTQTTASKEDAMRSLARQYGVFYWDKWHKEYSTYFNNGACFTVLMKNAPLDIKIAVLQEVKEFFYNKKEEKVCVCGSHATYGIGNGAHSTWCKLYRK